VKREDDEVVERAAERARAAYAAFCGDKDLQPWKHAPSRLAWLTVARAVIDELRREG